MGLGLEFWVWGLGFSTDGVSAEHLDGLVRAVREGTWEE